MTDMKLSTAIREGSKLRPQGFGNYFGMSPSHPANILCSCALGAAYEAVSHKTGDMRDVEIETVFPVLSEIIIGTGDTLLGIIVELNDEERLSREAIADQVEAWGY